METNIKQLKCGQCEEDKHKIYRRENGEIVTECIKCGSQTEIIIRKPEIITQNNGVGGGSLCIFN